MSTVSPRAALVLGVAASLAILLSVPLAILAHGGLPGVVLIPFLAVGAMIARRQPHNPVGTILLLLTLAVVASADAGKYASMAYRHGYHLPLARVGVFLAPGAWVSLIVLLPLPLALFPDGRLTRPWRRVVWAYLVFCAALVASIGWQDGRGVVARHIQVDSSGQLASFGNSSGGASTWDAVTIAIYLLFGLAWIVRLVRGYRSSTGDYRQQLKWLLTGAVLSITGLFFAVTTSGGASFWGIVGGVGFGLGLFALPVAFAVSILKYRLYDIDRLVSRTLSYLILTGLLAGVFVGLVVLTTRVLPFSSPVAVAASTLAAAALFNPLRRRIQRLVDRRFNRARYDAEATVAAFRTQLRDAVDPSRVEAGMLEVVGRAVEPAHVSVWLRQPGSGSPI